MAGFAPFDWLITYDLAEALIIFLFAVLTALIINVFLKTILASITKRTNTTLDDDLVQASRMPIFLAMTLIGLYFSLNSITSIQPHMSWLSQVIVVLGIILLFFLIHRIIKSVVRWYSIDFSPRMKGKEFKHLSIFGKIADVLLVIFCGLTIMSYLKINVTPLLTGLGIGGLAVALALQETLSNFIAGLSIIGDKSIKVGDYVELENGMGGHIEDISWRTSRIKTLSGDYVIVPNNKLSQSITKDYNFGSPQTYVGIDISISYNSDLDKVERIVKKVAKQIQNEVEGAVKGYEPTPRFKRFGDSSIEFSVYLKVNSYPEQAVVKSEFIKAIKKEFDKNRIEMSTPARYIYNIRKR